MFAANALTTIFWRGRVVFFKTTPPQNPFQRSISAYRTRCSFSPIGEFNSVVESCAEHCQLNSNCNHFVMEAVNDCKLLSSKCRNNHNAEMKTVFTIIERIDRSVGCPPGFYYKEWIRHYSDCSLGYCTRQWYGTFF